MRYEGLERARSDVYGHTQSDERREGRAQRVSCITEPALPGVMQEIARQFMRFRACDHHSPLLRLRRLPCALHIAVALCGVSYSSFWRAEYDDTHHDIPLY